MELLYQYIWQYKMLPRPTILADGRPFSIQHPGILNNGSGPDFSSAKIKIENNLWAGNVEIHVKASDWFRHQHHLDPAYDNILLHVVGQDDTRVARTDGSEIPVYVASLPRNLYLTWEMLQSRMKGVKCTPSLPLIPHLTREDWLETLSMERIHSKAERILTICDANGGDWAQSMFATLARGLGFGLNSEPFEILANSLPLNYIYRHSDDTMQIEALLFGQAGILDPSLYPEDAYYQRLCQEYQFLMRKYSLRPMRRELWKYSRTRPGNFPHRRVAMLAQFLAGGFSLTSDLLDAAGNIDKLMEVFSGTVSQYWQEHDNFGSLSTSPAGRSLSASSIELLIINVAVPFYFAYASRTGDPELAATAVSMMHRLHPERNRITQFWQHLGFESPDALRSQALIHLWKEYCLRDRCTECRFGHHLLRREAIPPVAKALSQYARPANEEVIPEGDGILVALDSFKGCLSSKDAGEALATGIREALPDMKVTVAAVADGGEGTASAIGEALNLPKVEVDTFDALMRPITATYRYDERREAAYIDMASAAGLTLLKEEERNPLFTTTYGVGLMIENALLRGAKWIVLGLGGSATNDAGLGCLQALGLEIAFHSSHPKDERPISGKDLEYISEIHTTRLRERLKGVRILLACDVENPFCGHAGAVAVYAEQKGADAGSRATLEKGMMHVRDMISACGSTDLNTVEGSGAAGGMAGGLHILAGGEIHKGGMLLAKSIRLDRLVREHAMIVTGEGRSDRQTLSGKLPQSVLQLSERMQRACVLVAGEIKDEQQLAAAGFAEIININTGYGKETDPTLPQIARYRLKKAGQRIALLLDQLE